MHLITHADTDEETVYQITKTIYENAADVQKRHAIGKAINPQVVVRNTGTEFHPGAVRYYKEIGIWPEDAEAKPEPKADEPAADDAASESADSKSAE